MQDKQCSLAVCCICLNFKSSLICIVSVGSDYKHMCGTMHMHAQIRSVEFSSSLKLKNHKSR